MNPSPAYTASWPSHEREETQRRRAEYLRSLRVSNAATREFLDGRIEEIERQLAECQLPYQRKILTEILATLRGDSLHS